MPDDKRKPTKPDPAASADPRPFDVKTVEYLVRLMAEHDLAEVDLKEGEHRVRIRKGGAFAAPAVVHSHVPAHAPIPTAAPTPAAPTPAAPPAAAGPKLLEVKSELIGTFYAKPKPDKDDYVKVGSKVTPDTVICQIEAMKIFNEIKAGVSGTVREVCVKNGDFVDFGAVLLRVDPAS